MSRRAWAVSLGVITLSALALRVGYVIGWKLHAVPGGDAYYYHAGANLFADGKGLVDPYVVKLRHQLVPNAQHPPLYIVVLALPSVLGFRTYLDHQLFSCLLGAAAVLLTGLAARRVASPGAGLMAACLAAVYPNYWLNDGLVMSETLSILATALVILAAYRFVQRPTLGGGAGLGAAIALAALTRAELLLLTALLMLPLVLRMSGLAWRRRLGLLVVSGMATALVTAPVVADNMSRFRQPEYLSTGLGPALVVSNCDSTFGGPFRGWWKYTCITGRPTPPGDASEQDVAYRKIAIAYVKDHQQELPSVIGARLGRVWGFYRPLQQLNLDRIETRELPASRVGLAMFYALVFGSVAGVVVLFRRRVTIVPLLAPMANVSLTVVAIYGTTRFRAAAEPSLVVLAAVAFDSLAQRMLGRRTTSTSPDSAATQPANSSNHRPRGATRPAVTP